MVSQLVEPYTKWYADLVKLPSDEVAKQFVDLGIFQGVDFLNNLLFADVGAKIMGFIEGISAHLIAGYGPISGRDKEDLQLLGSALMWELLDPKPEDLVNLANLIASIKSGIQYGSWTPLASALGAKSPEDVTRVLNNIVASFQRAFGGVPSPLYSTPPTLTPSLPTLPLPPSLSIENSKKVAGTLSRGLSIEI